MAALTSKVRMVGFEKLNHFHWIRAVPANVYWPSSSAATACQLRHFNSFPGDLAAKHSTKFHSAAGPAVKLRQHVVGCNTAFIIMFQ